MVCSSICFWTGIVTREKINKRGGPGNFLLGADYAIFSYKGYPEDRFFRHHAQGVGKMKVALLILLLLPVGARSLPGQVYGRGQLSNWVQWEKESWSENRFGIRYIPELSWGEMKLGGMELDAEVAFKGRVNGVFNSPGVGWDEYRLWGRVSGDQYEVRIGLQKINFGSATLLRPLMWFDRIDPRDPLGLTGGVWGILGRHYFLNNANFWLWAVRGDDNPGGGNLLPSKEGGWEIGGRGQVPAGPGEIGMTVHARKVDPTGLFPGAIFGGLPESGSLRENILNEMEEMYSQYDFFDDEGVTGERFAELEMMAEEPFREWRLGLDGRWDWTIGIWIEGMVVHQDAPEPLCKYLQMMTVGADYTLPVGSGLHVLGEHLVSGFGEGLFEREEMRHISAFSASYSPGMLDRLMAVGYYDWDEEMTARYVSWGRIYDNWSFYLNGFWNSADPAFSAGSASGAGKGVQLMAVFNHGRDLW
jgi:hypothetical protein